MKPEIERAGNPHQRECEQRAPRGRHVQVKDLLRQSLPGLDRGVRQGQQIYPSQRDQRDPAQGQPTADDPARGLE